MTNTTTVIRKEKPFSPYFGFKCKRHFNIDRFQTVRSPKLRDCLDALITWFMRIDVKKKKINLYNISIHPIVSSIRHGSRELHLILFFIIRTNLSFFQQLK